MSSARALRGTLRCRSCQWQALQTFASFAGLSFTTARPSAIRALAHPAAPKAFTTSWIGRADLSQSELQEKSKASEESSEILADIAAKEGLEELEQEPLSSPATAPSQDPTVPWYLQVEQPEKAELSLSERQNLPELPPDPPEHFETMLEHLFTDIGLDDLQILDLRGLEPPPALGTNLMMILGTARSEKHLHVSADRFCRWLRSTYKLRPYPDGLLGRNELKIKLRRKARRAKLMGGKATTSADVDDGIRTGWVCVNVGAIEQGRETTPEELEEAGIIGFGGAEQGVHLVVQMMTEEKREELNLEKLWLDAMARQERKKARATVAEAERLNAVH